MKTTTIFAIIVLLMTISSCFLKKNTTEDKMNNPNRIPPDMCLFEGKIIEILPIDKNATKPCSEYPCQATVEIIKVIAYGSSFNSKMSAGSKQQMQFKYTLNPTKKIFPEKKNRLPGLKVGDKFKSYVTASQIPMQDKPLLTIEDYSIIK